MYPLLRPLLFALEPARAHMFAMAALAPVEHLGPMRYLLEGALRVHPDPRLRVKTMGLEFPTPVGLAAGMDMSGWSSWARSDEPALLAFTPDRRLESIEARLQFGSMIRMRFT